MGEWQMVVGVADDGDDRLRVSSRYAAGNIDLADPVTVAPHQLDSRAVLGDLVEQLTPGWFDDEMTHGVSVRGPGV